MPNVELEPPKRTSAFRRIALGTWRTTYDPQVYGPYRVFRGGGWADPPWACRASCRRKSHPTYKNDDLGLRLARSPSP